jgi:hypothetical protein
LFDTKFLTIERKKMMMIFVEILALCGITHLFSGSYLLPLRARILNVLRGYAIAHPHGTGFWVGFIAYAAVVLCNTYAPGTNFMFPMAQTLAKTDGCVQLPLVFLLGGLIGIAFVVLNYILVAMYSVNLLLDAEVAKRQHMQRMVNMLKWSDEPVEQERSGGKQSSVPPKPTEMFGKRE